MWSLLSRFLHIPTIVGFNSTKDVPEVPFPPLLASIRRRMCPKYHSHHCWLQFDEGCARSTIPTIVGFNSTNDVPEVPFPPLLASIPRRMCPKYHSHHCWLQFDEGCARSTIPTIVGFNSTKDVPEVRQLLFRVVLFQGRTCLVSWTSTAFVASSSNTTPPLDSINIVK